MELGQARPVSLPVLVPNLPSMPEVREQAGVSDRHFLRVSGNE